MDDKITDILVELVERIANYFKLEREEAIEVVALSNITNKLSENTSLKDIDIEEITNNLISEISRPGV